MSVALSLISLNSLSIALVPSAGINAPRGKRGLRGKRGGKVSKSIAGLAHLEVSPHALYPLVPLSNSWRSPGAQL